MKVRKKLVSSKIKNSKAGIAICLEKMKILRFGGNIVLVSKKDNLWITMN